MKHLPREPRTRGLLMGRTKHPLRGTVEGAIRRTLFSKLQRSPSRACNFSNLPIQLYWAVSYVLFLKEGISAQILERQKTWLPPQSILPAIISNVFLAN